MLGIQLRPAVDRYPAIELPAAAGEDLDGVAMLDEQPRVDTQEPFHAADHGGTGVVQQREAGGHAPHPRQRSSDSARFGECLVLCDGWTILCWQQPAQNEQPLDDLLVSA